MLPAMPRRWPPWLDGRAFRCANHASHDEVASIAEVSRQFDRRTPPVLCRLGSFTSFPDRSGCNSWPYSQATTCRMPSRSSFFPLASIARLEFAHDSERHPEASRPLGPSHRPRGCARRCGRPLTQAATATLKGQRVALGPAPRHHPCCLDRLTISRRASPHVRPFAFANSSIIAHGRGRACADAANPACRARPAMPM